MSDISIAAARVLARNLGRAIPVVERGMLAPDPDEVFGIAPVRVVSEQRVQAIAFGLLEGSPPRVVTIWNPLSRESDELTPFAEALDAYLMDTLREGRLPRIWLPHAAALEIVDILGQRYRTNPNASPALQRMGWQCRAIVEESKYRGQQVLAVAGDLLRAHLATGQSAVEDHHLGALLAWVDPPPGVDPVAAAERQSLIPAAAMLERAVDDEVEYLRSIAKKGNSARAADARRRIEEHLRRGGVREWDLLMRARRAFWGLGLPPAPLAGLVEKSRERLEISLSYNLRPPSRPDSLANLLYDYELAMEQVEDALVRSDDSVRERARRKGKAVMAEVLAVDQPHRGRHPCTLTLRTTQSVLRVRRGTRLQTLDASVVGRVLTIWEDGTGGTLIELRLEKGVQSTRRPHVGAHMDWVDTVVYDGRYLRRKVNIVVRAVGPALVYGDRLPPAVVRELPAENLASIAEHLRRP